MPLCYVTLTNLAADSESLEGVCHGLGGAEFSHEGFVELALHGGEAAEQHVFMLTGQGGLQHCVAASGGRGGC